MLIIFQLNTQQRKGADTRRFDLEVGVTKHEYLQNNNSGEKADIPCEAQHLYRQML